LVVHVIRDEFIKDKSKKVIAKNDAKALVAYLISLKFTELPEDMAAPEFIPLKEKDKELAGSSKNEGSASVDGKRLYESTSAVCHQSNGEGVARSEEHTSELQSRFDLVCRLLLEKK